MRRIHDPYQPIYRYAVWLDPGTSHVDLAAWFRQARPRGSYRVEPTEVLFVLAEDAVMFDLAWGRASW